MVAAVQIKNISNLLAGQDITLTRLAFFVSQNLFCSRNKIVGSDEHPN
jgi:hypothetical protein